MRGIYIPRMEKPKNCRECPFLYVTIICDGTKDCPLIPVPEHGRLIDADAFLDDLLFPSKQFEQGMRELVGDAPTIIPADKVGEG